LESGWTVSHTKEHYQGFKQPAVGMEHGLLFISRLDMHIVEALADIELGKVLHSAELQYKFRDQRKGVLVFDCYGIERLVVLDQAEQTILFLDKEDWGSHRGFGGSNLSGTQVFFKKDI